MALVIDAAFVSGQAKGYVAYKVCTRVFCCERYLTAFALQAVWLEGWKMQRATLTVKQLGAQRDASTLATMCRDVLGSFKLLGKVIGVTTDGAADESNCWRALP